MTEPRRCFFFALTIAMAGCSTSGGADAGSDGACPSPVGPGAACATEGATACGPAPQCTDIGGGTTTCTCTQGKWNCGSCPACGAAVLLGRSCGIGEVCSGPTSAVFCNGTSVPVSGSCRCNNGWECDGVDAGANPCPDAGADSSTDASDAAAD